MIITIYSKEGCKICEAAKRNAEGMGFSVEVKEIGPYLQVHDGWRTDESMDILVAYHRGKLRLPVIEVKGQYMGYPEAMKRLKEVRNG